jgi:hypothetical protein
LENVSEAVAGTKDTLAQADLYLQSALMNITRTKQLEKKKFDTSMLITAKQAVALIEKILPQD